MNKNSSYLLNKEFDYKDLFKPYLKRWKWFALSAVSLLILAFIYIRYTTPEYAIQATIQILQDQNGGSEFSAFQDLGLLNTSNTQVEDEIAIIKSRSNLIQVVKDLGLNIKITAQGNINNTEIYENPPLKVKYLVADSLLFLINDEFNIQIESESSFIYSDKELLEEKKYSFGSTIKTEWGEFVLIPNIKYNENQKGKKYIVSINPLVSVAQNYQLKIQTSVNNPLSNIVTLSLNDPVVAKGIDVLNTLINSYNKNAIADKKEIADKTSEFINDRINDIYGDLSSVDRSAEVFKSGRGITDVASQSNTNYNIGAQSQQDLQNANIQLNIAASMKDIVDNQQGYNILPANVGLSDASIVNITARYNELVLERNRLLKDSNEKNPIIINLDQQLEGLKQGLQSSLNGVTNNLNLQVNNLSSQLSQINARIYAAPGNERALRDITRQQQTTEALYLYLLQKREESQITFASSSPKSKIIDSAYGVSDFPISPKKPVIVLAAFILGMLLPFTAIYAYQLLDNKVHNKVTLEKYVGSIPVLAELPQLKKRENSLVKAGERTILAESLRILRTNLDFVINSKKSVSGIGNVIFVTSSVPEEGKTLISANLAMIYAKANKKVLLLGADIRNPKIYQFYSGNKIDQLGKSKRDKFSKGLSDYLQDKTIDVSDIITPTLAHDQMIDVIFSGKIPPNPAELLMNERMKELLNILRTYYDYIIVDTAPLMVVSDTLLISKYADQLLYVVRANFTELKVLEFPLKLYNDGKLKRLSFIVNGVKDSNLGYGGRYGYGYGKSPKKWWKFG